MPRPHRDGCGKGCAGPGDPGHDAGDELANAQPALLAARDSGVCQWVALCACVSVAVSVHRSRAAVLV